ncbi:hypothetical protein JQ543_21170 [Bradyrhizobium diazoefficiens]|nr:hypothetical protein [Bradyrhizobium diazoefficiens]MBR0850271.1 hypothetical protein [Bradyrhizobium diazoefficiens]
MQALTIRLSSLTKIAIAILTIVSCPLVGLSASEPAVGEDRMVLGPRQFETDKGAGAVLCAWSMYLSVRTQTTACAVSRQPVDDAIDEAISAIDGFIITNSSLHPTHEMLEDFKRRAGEAELRHARQLGMQKYCENNLAQHFRRQNPDQVRASVKGLLAVPREPVMNPCL